ncbi:uncharacterized protein [Diabrotica undecimpunctata]|uniref:uncharacterized protein isoform X2 n=1 Tax=Diabrotica undecimpunctata TaxID=50387 RepID=UPI003B6367CD
MSTTTETIPQENKSSDLGATVLNISKEIKWKFLIVLSAMPNYMSWNMFILATTVLNYILVTTNLSFLPTEVVEFFPFYVIFDAIYLFNFLLLLAQKIFDIPNVFYTEKTMFIIFVVDFVSLASQVMLIIPFFTAQNSFLVLIFRVITFVRLRHLLVFNKVLRRLTEYRVLWFLGQYITTVVIIIHTAIYLWFLIRSEDNFYDKLPEFKSGEVSSSNSHWYFYHIYAVIQLLMNVGFGDVYPKNINEIYFFSIIFLIGQALTVYFICVVSWIIINRNYYKLSIYYQIKNVKKYLNGSHPLIKQTADNYFSMKEHKQFKDQSLLDALPRCLKQDIAYDLNCGLLHRSLLLNSLPKYILRNISSEMKTVILPAGESIYFQYVVKSGMVCIEDGALEILHDDDEESPVIYFGTGTIFGEISLFLNIPSKVTVRATKRTELRILEKKDFLKVMLHFPQQLKYLHTALKIRLNKASTRQNSSKTRVQNLRKMKNLLGFGPIDDDGVKDTNFYELYKLVDQDLRDNTFDEYNWIKIWKLMNGLAQIVFCILHFYYAAFVTQIPYYVYTLEIFAAIACVLDLILQCHSYKKSQKKSISTSTILDAKLSNWKFYFDVLSLLPMEIWAYTFENIAASNRFYALLKVNRLLRLYRVTDVVYIVMGSNYPNLVYQISVTSLLMILAIYFVSCLLYITSCFYILCKDTGWYFLSSKETYPDNQNPKNALLNSVYFTVSSVFHTGIGDFLPKNSTDFLLVTVILVIFLILKTYLSGQIISLIFLNELCSGSLNTRYYLKSFSEFYRISKPFKRKIINYLKINPNFLQETSSLFIRKHAPASVDTLIHISRTKNIDEGPLFKHVDSYFLALIEKDAKMWLLPKNETLYIRGDPTRIMYIISEGFCKLYNSENNPEKSVGPGSYLGYLEAIYCIPKKHTVVSTTDCRLICLEYAVMEKIFKLFPKELDFLEKTKYRDELVAEIRKFERVERELPVISHVITQDEEAFVNINKTDYFKLYKTKLGPFWFISFLFLPATIHPEGLFIRVWCVLRAFLITIQGIVLILLIMLPPFATEMSWLDFTCQLTLYLDMYLGLHIGYYDGKGMLRVHPVYTAWYYFTHGFLLDLIAAISWPLFMFHAEDEDVDKIFFHSTHCFWNLLKLVQFIKVYKCLSYFQNRTFESFVSIRILKSFLFIIVIANFLTGLAVNYFCQFVTVSNFTNNLSVHDAAERRINLIRCKDAFFLDTWMPKFPDMNEIYTAGMYIILSLLTNTGIGDIIAMTTTTKIATVLIIIVGYFIFAMLTVTVCSIMLAEAEESFEFRQNSIEMLKFLKRNQIPPTLRKQVLNHLELIWTRSQGFNIKSHEHLSSGSYFNAEFLMHRNEMLLKTIPLFPNLDANYLNILLSKMKILFFQKEDSIIRYKDVISDIYIVVSGQVDICNKNGEHMYTLGPAGVFGNIRKTANSSSTLCVKARRNVEIWALDTETFFNTVSYYPIVLKDLERHFKEHPNYLVAKSTSQFDFFGSSKELDDLESDTESTTKTGDITITEKCATDFFLPNKWFKFSLNPDHILFNVVDIITLLASLLNIYFIPYVFVTQDSSTFGFLYLCLEPIFYLRVFIKLHKAYVNTYGSTINVNSIICKKYLNNPGEIFWDLIPNLPVGLLCFIFRREEWFFFYSCFRILHMLRFYYIIKYFDQKLKTLHQSTWYYLARLLICYSSLIHILSCIWFILACPFLKCSSDSWLKHYGHAILDSSTSYKLLLSYYCILNNLTITGIGDTYPVTYSEVIFTIITMLLGKIAVAMIIDYPLLKADKYLKNLWMYSDRLLKSKLLIHMPYSIQQDLTSALYETQIRKSYIFKDIDQNLLRQICTKLQKTVYFENDYIVKTGEVNSTMYFIEKGSICVLTKQADHLESTHALLQSRDVFGVSQGLNLEEYHHFCYRVASLVVELLELKFNDWEYLLEFFPRDKKQIFGKHTKEYY